MRGENGRHDPWLWEHCERVRGLALMLARLPEWAAERPNEDVVSVSVLFHKAGWSEQVRSGLIDRWQVFARPTSDVQRELAIDAMRERVAALLPDDVVDTAAEVIRQYTDRFTTLPEAQVLAEAENLEGMGLMFVLRQFRQYQAEGRPLEQMLVSWQTQREYRYWDVRINDGLRFEFSRTLARERIAAVDKFLSDLRVLLSNSDVRAALEQLGSARP